MGLSIHLTFSHCPANLAQIHSVYVAMYLSSSVVSSDQHLPYFLCQHDLEVLGSAPTRKKRFHLPWWFSTASLQICSSQSESGLHLIDFLKSKQAAGSKAFPVNDFTCGRKRRPSFALIRHSGPKWMWPALGQFAELFSFLVMVTVPCPDLGHRWHASQWENIRSSGGRWVTSTSGHLGTEPSGWSNSGKSQRIFIRGQVVLLREREAPWKNTNVVIKSLTASTQIIVEQSHSNSNPKFLFVFYFFLLINYIKTNKAQRYCAI